ncbi:MAG: TIGR00730 family Rossman fold protein [Pseudomonadota bacterium]
MTHSIAHLCVYCGSSPGHDAAFANQAALLGTLMAKANIRLVYGGGDAGLMGTIAKAVLAGGGQVTGIIPTFFFTEAFKVTADGLDGAKLIEVPDMHTRKQMMFERSDAFIALPGGIGTLEELVEMLTWAQLGRHSKPVALLDVNGFWAPFTQLCDHMAEAGFLHNAKRATPKVFAGAAEAMGFFTTYGKD